MPIVIKKRVSLDFLGSEHKEDYLEFRAIPLKDYEELVGGISAIQDDNAKAMKFILDLLEKQFIGGKFDNEKVTKEDLKDIDAQTATSCFEALTGQLNPKDEGQSPTQSSTEASPPQN